MAKHRTWMLGIAVLLAGCAEEAPPIEPILPPASDLAEDESLRTDIYDAAVDACEMFPPRGNEDPITAAEEYAEGYQDEFEQAAFDGCLEGFRRAGAIP